MAQQAWLLKVEVVFRLLNLHMYTCSLSSTCTLFTLSLNEQCAAFGTRAR